MLALLEEYHRLVQRYRREKLDVIQRDLERWKPGRLQQATTVLLDVARQPIPGAGLNVSPWRPIDIAAATVLHLELFVDGAKHGVFEHWNLRVASQLLATPAGTRVDPMLRRDAMTVVAWLLQISGQFELLRSHLDAAVDEAPPPELLMALGVLQEASASPRVQPHATRGRADDGLMQAADTYRRVLRADPTLAEARVRLGFVLLRLGRIDEARAELAAALDRTAHTKVRYLAALFHGAAQEASGHHDGARASFQQAHELAPPCQVAALALAQLLWLEGQTDDAASLLKQPAHTGPAACDDPWWSYDFGQAWQLEASLERLRTGVRA